MISIKKTIDADVAIVGGGIGGLMAAISAVDAGAENVVILEKMNTKRSGSGATGNDHFMCYMPEYHGDDVEPILMAAMQGPFLMGKDPAIMRAFLLGSADIVRQWEEWGIEMRPTGEWNYEGHAMPGKPRVALKFNGRNQKAVLTKEAKKRKVTTLNHHPVVELAKKNGRIAGVLALNMKEETPSFTLVRSANVILATGLTHRLYHAAPSPGSMFNTGHCPNNAGGQALGWRVGAKMVNMELPYTHAGPKFFGRCGKGTWLGVFRYPDGRPLGPFVTKSNREYGDVTADIWNTAFTDVLMNGEGPARIDCSDASAEDLSYMKKAMLDEGLSAQVTYMEEEGIDPAKHSVEFMRYEPILHGRGLEVDINGATCIPGLYAAGDMVGNVALGLGFASWMGSHCGKRAAADLQPPQEDIDQVSAIQNKIRLLSSFMEKEIGAQWQEANFALQQIMDDYAAVGPYKVRSETLLTAGLQYLNLLRSRTVSNLRATCSHTLMRASEVLDLFDCAEVIFHSALERKETRDMHKRSDYTFTNPLLGQKILTVALDDDKNIIKEWRDKIY